MAYNFQLLSSEDFAFNDNLFLRGATQISVHVWVRIDDIDEDHTILDAAGIPAMDGIVLFADDVGNISGRTNQYKLYYDESPGDSTQVEGATVHRTGGDHSIIADKIFIGTLDDESEPLVLGEQLRDFIDQFLAIFVNNAPAFTLPTIGIGPLSPGVVEQIKKLRRDFGTTGKGRAQEQGVLCGNNFVTRQ